MKRIIPGVMILLITSLYGEGLSPGDMLRLTVFRYEELSGEYIVNDDGTIYLPLTGKVNTGGIDIDSLRSLIHSSYKIYIANPQILIIPLYRITVLGNVIRPGVFYVSGRETFSHLLAMAGGTTETSDIKRAYIMRESGKLPAHLETRVISGDILYIPRQWWPTWSEWSTILSTVALGFSVYISLR